MILEAFAGSWNFRTRKFEFGARILELEGFGTWKGRAVQVTNYILYTMYHILDIIYYILYFPPGAGDRELELYRERGPCSS